MKGEDGVPVPNPETHTGLVMAFELASDGKSDGEVAQALNTKGYRTVGNRGNRPFANHSVRGMLTNRFYLGHLTDGQGGWTRGRHEPFVDQDLWDRAEAARRRHRNWTHSRRPAGKRTWSLTGLTFCWKCKGRVHTQYVYKGKPRLGCFNRQKGWGCRQKSSKLSVYEAQVAAYIGAFHIPEDYQERILEYHRNLEAAYNDAEQERAVLESRLKRLRELYEWDDITKADYETRRDQALRQLETLVPVLGHTDHLDKLATFLEDVPAGWTAATQEQRNKLARALFDQVWVEDDVVVAVKPGPELEPFFRLNYEECQKQILEVSTRRRVELPV